MAEKDGIYIAGCMREVYVNSYNIISSLGMTIEENFDNILNNVSGVSVYPYRDRNVSLSKIDWRRIDESFSSGTSGLSALERILIRSIETAAGDSSIDLAGGRTLFVFSTTKGNIDLLDKNDCYNIKRNRVNIIEMTPFITSYFKNPNRPLTISNACISGVSAIIAAARLIRSGLYDNAVIAGGDVISEFVVSGFSSLKALSPEPCMPFDRDRKGLSLGEAAGTIILSSEKKPDSNFSGIAVLGGSVSNDANHISGPSRDGYGLSLAVEKAVKSSGIGIADIDSVSAHGTATDFNDEMESKAFEKSGLRSVPVFSLKGYFGHTLGAAGIIESVVSVHSMSRGIVPGSTGCKDPGVTGDITVNKESRSAENNICIKTASGFGGCNAAVVFKKV